MFNKVQCIVPEYTNINFLSLEKKRVYCQNKFWIFLQVYRNWELIFQYFRPEKNFQCGLVKSRVSSSSKSTGMWIIWWFKLQYWITIQLFKDLATLKCLSVDRFAIFSEKFWAYYQISRIPCTVQTRIIWGDLMHTILIYDSGCVGEPSLIYHY